MRKTRKKSLALIGAGGRNGAFSHNGDNVRELFDTLKVQWEREAQGVSNYARITSHPAYLRIIGQGSEILPSIFEDLDGGGGPWFAALAAITGENPVKPKHRKNSSLMRQDWLQWGKAHGYHA